MKGLSVLVTFALLAFAHLLKGHLQQAGRLPADQRVSLERPAARPAAHTDIILVAKKANTHALN